jgi:GH15 family glucan-1,4-alpha-glucosidase
MTQRSFSIRNIALVGNRRTAAAIDGKGEVVWYCPGRFDAPSLFASLLDATAGSWRILLPGAVMQRRRYVGESAVLETTLHTEKGGDCVLTDWMPLGGPAALCRMLSPAPVDTVVEIVARPAYGTTADTIVRDDKMVVVDGRYRLYASSTPSIVGGAVRYRVSAGESAWFVLADEPIARVNAAMLNTWRVETLHRWNALHWHTRYSGPYERQVKDSLRALRLLTFEDNGGIVAAATLGLPEVIGGERNYDYRYVWLRDAAMIVSALTRAGSDGVEERRFLEFLCDARAQYDGPAPFPPFMTLSGKAPPPMEPLPWDGFRGSKPVWRGNGARKQLQLDGLSNLLLAAKLIYNRYGTREHWPVVREVADFLAAHWREPDHGIWEESQEQQYTASKVITACALRFIAEYAETPAQAAHWRHAADHIRAFIERYCRAADGAYAAVAGGQAVDVSAALFPVWTYCPPDSPEMCATMARLERDYSRDGLLYWRHLECFDARREGAFLAGTLWVAQYWVMRGDCARAERILHAALAYANDLGLFAEEALPANGEMLGNLPQAFVHAALIGLVVDMKAAREA